MAKPTIFLDIDGVLNTHKKHHATKYHAIEREYALLFDYLLERADAEFVLSSAWRYLVHGGSMNLTGLQHLFSSHWIDGRRLVGITRKDFMVRTGMIVRPMENERGKQISEYIAEHNITNYVVFDNDDLGISRAGHPFIHVNGDVGLTFRNTSHATLMLNV